MRIEEISESKHSHLPAMPMMEYKQRNRFDDMPKEMLFHIASCLTMHDITVLHLNKKNTFIFLSAWQEKFKQHFPEDFAILKNKNVSDSYDYRKAFKQAEEKHYSSRKYRNLFRWTKDGTLRQLQKSNLTVLQLIQVKDDAPRGLQRSLVDWAVRNKHQAILDYFYLIIRKQYSIDENDIDIFKRTDDEMTIVLWAAALNQIEDMPLLLAKDPSVVNDVQPSNGTTALMWAAQNGYRAMVRSLLEHGANVHIVHKKHGATALMRAAQENDVEVMELLLEYGANAEAARESDGATAFLLAAHNGRIRAVEFLHKYKVNVNVRTRHGITALIWASKSGCLRLVKLLLLQTNIDVNACTTDDGTTALMWAAYKGYPAVVECLLKAGANAQAQRNDKWTALMLAAQEGHLPVVTLLLFHAADSYSESAHHSIKNALCQANAFRRNECASILKMALKWKKTNLSGISSIHECYCNLQIFIFLIETLKNLRLFSESTMQLIACYLGLEQIEKVYFSTVVKEPLIKALAAYNDSWFKWHGKRATSLLEACNATTTKPELLKIVSSQISFFKGTNLSQKDKSKPKHEQPLKNKDESGDFCQLLTFQSARLCSDFMAP